MYGPGDLRKGLKIEMDGVPYEITEFSFMKPGKGQAVYNCRLRNMANGSTTVKTYRSNDSIDEPRLEFKHLRYTYDSGDDLIFNDEHYEEIVIKKTVLGPRVAFLVEDIEVDVTYHNGAPIDVQFPNFIEKKIVQTNPGLRGDTATNVLKPATVEGGYEISVPLFINEGDVVRIDTRTGQYADRVSKK